MILKFDDSLITGITDIDVQHKFLFDAINSLSEITADDKRKTWFIVCDIEEYASAHFKTEEEYMADFNYPEMEEHVFQHRNFCEKYKTLKDQLEKEGISESFVANLRTFLVKWIVDHYTEIDVKMAAFIKKTSKKSL